MYGEDQLENITRRRRRASIRMHLYTGSTAVAETQVGTAGCLSVSPERQQRDGTLRERERNRSFMTICGALVCVSEMPWV